MASVFSKKFYFHFDGVLLEVSIKLCQVDSMTPLHLISFNLDGTLIYTVRNNILITH